MSHFNLARGDELQPDKELKVWGFESIQESGILF